MKRLFISLLLALVTIVTFAQNPTDGTLKFLGIPIDGTKENMITQLKARDSSIAPMTIASRGSSMAKMLKSTW